MRLSAQRGGCVTNPSSDEVPRDVDVRTVEVEQSEVRATEEHIASFERGLYENPVAMLRSMCDALAVAATGNKRTLVRRIIASTVRKR